MGVPPADVPQVPELSLPPILEAAVEAKPEEAPAEAKPEEAPAETKPEEAPAETKPEEAPAEAKPEEVPAEKEEEAPAKLTKEPLDAKEYLDSVGPRQAARLVKVCKQNNPNFKDPRDEAPAETKPDETPAETKPEEAPAEKPEEAIINEVVKDVVQDALGVPRSERSNATPEAKPDEAPKAPETGNDKIDEAKEVYDELVKGADFDPPPDIKRAHSDVAEEASKASKVAKVDVTEPQTPRPVTSTA